MKNKKLLIAMPIILIIIVLTVILTNKQTTPDTKINNQQTIQNTTSNKTEDLPNKQNLDIQSTNVDKNLLSAEKEWKLYENKDLGLSLIYPNGWILENENTKYKNQNNIDLIYRPSTTQDYPDKNKPMDATINIRTINNPNNKSLQEIFNIRADECDNQYGMCMSATDVSKMKKYKIDDFNVFEYGYKPISGEGGGFPGNTIYIKKNNFFILVSVMNLNLKNTYDPVPVFEKVISSIELF